MTTKSSIIFVISRDVTIVRNDAPVGEGKETNIRDTRETAVFYRADNAR